MADIKSKIEFNKIELGKTVIPPKEFIRNTLRNDMEDIKSKGPSAPSLIS